MGVGGLHVVAQVAAAPDADRVLAAVAAHEVPHRVLEPGVVQGVQLGQPVPQACARTASHRALCCFW